MNFVAKQVATNKFFRTVEIFIDDPSILDGTKLFYIDGDTEAINMHIIYMDYIIYDPECET
jgi:hypothetical protein